MNYWIFKTEPSNYSIDDLQKDKVTEWSGIRNYQVRNMIRDEMNIGDTVLIYHSSTKEIGITGEAKIVSKAHPDPEQFKKRSQYFDLKSLRENPTWLSVQVEFIQKFKEILPLNDMKKESSLQNMRLLQRGNRLSITPISKSQYTALKKLLGTKKSKRER